MIFIDTSNARLRTRSSLSRRNTIFSHNNLFIYSVSKNKTSLNDVFSDIPIFQSRTSKRDFFVENSWFHRKPLVFHRTIPDTRDLTSYSNSSKSKTLRSILMENSWFHRKLLVFHRTIPDTRDLTSNSNSSKSKTLRSILMENSWFHRKLLVFHRTILDTKDLSSDSSSSMSKTPRSMLTEISWLL